MKPHVHATIVCCNHCTVRDIVFAFDDNHRNSENNLRHDNSNHRDSENDLRHDNDNNLLGFLKLDYLADNACLMFVFTFGT